ncbi:MAG: CopG family transcriptional regulator [Clostridiaceae bacterium]|jgi:antitoxin component of RelBE/YafQ-DinJ toxin-antitoxin module|nr:CopG family transcriptional regulator [Clostridiaceae bacterium]
MAHISLRVTDKEKKTMENYADFHGITLSDAIKNVFFQKLEDEYDLQTIAEFENAEEQGDVEYKTFDEVISDLGLENEI